MPDFIKRTAVIITVVSAVIILLFSDFGASGRVYDCGMADWHPDIPTKVKEECRKLRLEEWNRQQQEDFNKKIIRT